MIPNLSLNTWASLTVWSKKVINDLKADIAGSDPAYIDWEAHNNQNELPNRDLIGPMSLSVTEYEDKLFQVTFAIGASTYTKDLSIARQRQYISRFFDRMQSGQKIDFYDHAGAEVRSVIQMLPGTMVSPMTDITVRPFQYVQGTGLIVPLSEKN